MVIEISKRTYDNRYNIWQKMKEDEYEGLSSMWKIIAVVDTFNEAQNLIKGMSK